VLKSDIDKRDRDFARVGRTAAQPVVSSLFIHSVGNMCRSEPRSSVSMGPWRRARVRHLPHQPDFPSVCLLSCQRASYSLGSYIGANPKSFEPATDPYLATFMKPQTRGTNSRMAFLRSTNDKVARQAFDADAGYGACVCDTTLSPTDLSTDQNPYLTRPPFISRARRSQLYSGEQLEKSSERDHLRQKRSTRPGVFVSR